MSLAIHRWNIASKINVTQRSFLRGSVSQVSWCAVEVGIALRFLTLYFTFSHVTILRSLPFSPSLSVLFPHLLSAKK